MTKTVKKSFEAEVNQVLHLLTHSLYSNREIFIRELISNASDAIDKRKFLELNDTQLSDEPCDPAIYIIPETKDGINTITIKDNGVGMDESELVQNLGTIARSGTKQFMEKLTQIESTDDKTQLIGQFGVGFYSSFVVADKVRVITRKVGASESEAVCWQSDGVSEYEISSANRAEVGTDIILYLKEDAKEFAQDWQLRKVINQYSDHISVPVYMPNAKTENAGDDQAEQEPFSQVNQGRALWTRPKSEITDQEYSDFYSHISHSMGSYLDLIHKNVEGNYSYKLLLFLPDQAPFDLWNRDSHRGLKLYVQRVFIMDKVEQFLPNYLRFIKGVIDSSDLPLNVSREILQHNRVIEVIKQSATKYVLDALKKMAEKDSDKYKKFWQNFGNVIKEGIGEDFQNQEKIQNLLRFSSTHDTSGEQSVSLADYVSRMAEGQDKIYYVVSDGYQSGLLSPHMEYFQKKGTEVLVLTDRIDEWMITRLSQYADKSLQSIASVKVEDDESMKVDEKTQDEMKDIISRLKEHFQDRVTDVVLTNKLTTSPCCVVGENHEMTLHLRKILKDAGQAVPDFKPTLELNPEHEMVKALASETSDEKFKLIADILFDQSILTEGGELSEPGRLVQNYNKWITMELKK